MVEEEIGDLLFAIINFARLAGIDPEFSLRKVTEKFIARVKYVEQIAFKEGLDLKKHLLATSTGCGRWPRRSSTSNKILKGEMADVLNNNQRLGKRNS